MNRQEKSLGPVQPDREDPGKKNDQTEEKAAGSTTHTRS